jgi:hypothetical protein
VIPLLSEPKEIPDCRVIAVNDAPTIKEYPMPFLQTKEDTPVDELPSIPLKDYAEDVDDKLSELRFFFEGGKDTIQIKDNEGRLICRLKIEGEDAQSQRIMIEELGKDAHTDDDGEPFILYLKDDGVPIPPAKEPQREAVVVVEAEAPISIHILEEDKDSVEGIEVILLKDGEPIESVKTGGDGVANFEGKVGTIYSVRVQKEGYKTQEKQLPPLPKDGLKEEIILAVETLSVYNFPNPFNTKETEYTTIKLWLPKDAEEVVIKLLDTATCSIREWRLGPLSSGTHIIEWYGRNDAGQDVGSGVYILVLEAHYVDGGLQRAFNKILLLRK